MDSRLVPRGGVRLSLSVRPALSVAAVTVAVNMVAGVLAVRLPPVRSVVASATTERNGYGRDPFLALPRLEASFVSRALGTLLELGPETSQGGRHDSAGDVAAAGRPPGPTPTPAPGLLPPVLASPDWDLEPSVYADRTAARPGDDIIYTVIVRNVGRADFDGHLRIDAHTPFGTTFENFEPPPCEGQDPPDCIFVPQPVPGPPTENVHAPSFSSNEPISAGEERIMRYRVSVNPGVPPGTQLSNHAHATTTSPPRTRTSKTVVVVVE